MHKETLHAGWTVRPVNDLSIVPANLREVSVPARVPGCVHTDLIRAKLIPDPYADFNEHELRWIGLADWEYSTTFVADAALFEHERIDLVADGLDTVATVRLNWSEVARTQNMHRGYRWDVKSLLREGENTLTVTFASPVRYAERMRRELGPRPQVNGPGGPFNFIRKMACNFGWDWGPALVTSGIWRPVRLEGWSNARISSVQTQLVELQQQQKELAPIARVQVKAELERAGSVKDQFRVSVGLIGQNCDDGDGAGRDLLVGESSATIELTWCLANLWWPRGYGDQFFYEMEIELFHYGRGAIERYKSKLGLRTIELDTSPDAIGSRFALKINGKEIFCKGFNWIPDDCFLDRACDPQRVRQRIQQCVDAGGNMLRVWGGGIFETDEFYDICDEMGVLVWQDFLFACAMYPEEEPFWSEVEAEARYNVQRLAHHPSLAIWNGCNENIWAYKDWGWQTHEDVVGKTWGKGYYLDLLPKVIAELDPSRPYWAASPWSGDPDVENGLAPNLSTHGNKHVWEAWFREDYSAYRQFAPRFCSEFGFQGPATFASIASVVPNEALDFGSKEMRHRQKSGDAVRDDGDRRNLRHLIRHFNLEGAEALLKALDPPDPDAKVPECGCGPMHPARHASSVNFDDLHYLLSLNQARALKLGVEWFRSRQPTCMGTLYWQLNDCWPGATSWSCIDGDGRKKPLWYATRRFYAPRLLTIQPEADALVLYANNNSDERWGGRVWLRRLDFAGRELGRFSVPLEALPWSNARVCVLPTAVAQPRDRSGEFIVAQAGSGRALWFFLPDKELGYPNAKFESALAREGDGYALTINSRVLLRDVLIQVDRLDPAATIDDNLITVLPGERATFKIQSKTNLTADQLTQLPVFNCANRFGRG